MTLTIQLPLPSAKLSPNGRCHWRTKAPITKDHKMLASLASTQARLKAGQEITGVESVNVAYDVSGKRVRFPGYRPTDFDNALGVCKAYLDGIAEGLGVDDRNFGSVAIQIVKNNAPGVTFEVTVK